eukprot:TRINITY_DN8923_c0_g1_i1.p1 TRINITY_DN8923_c0_g1~~TRINITY_DN8923_c0_g1_i1.p1  ORF type:complete len:137 (+),score=35.96 TRINITY_DN8923_c0_g1_i1:43-411(+)
MTGQEFRMLGVLVGFHATSHASFLIWGQHPRFNCWPWVYAAFRGTDLLTHIAAFLYSGWILHGIAVAWHIVKPLGGDRLRRVWLANVLDTALYVLSAVTWAAPVSGFGFLVWLIAKRLRLCW